MSESGKEKKRRYSSAQDPTRDRILTAALECISQTSINALSVRAIAARAGVNVATVHYYFGTKDAIVTKALERFFDQVVVLFEASMDADTDPKERLRRFLTAYTTLFHKNPGVFASMTEAISASIVRQETGRPTSAELVLVGMISKVKERLMGLIREAAGIEDEEVLMFKTIQLMTSLMHPALISTIPHSLFDIDFSDEANRTRYIDLTISSLVDAGGR